MTSSTLLNGRAHRRPGRGAALAAALSCVLVACDGSGVTGDVLTNSDGELGFTRPDFLSTRAVNEDFLRPRVLVNFVSVPARRRGPKWEATARVPEGSVADLSITWIETIGFRQLPLASIDFTTATITEDQPLLVLAEDYDIDRFDADNDGFGNLAERIANTNPFDAADPGPDFFAVSLPLIAPENAPTIDGAYEAIWDSAQYRDRNGIELLIDNLMIDRGATRLDGQTGYRWGGLHDGRYLYLIAFGESGAGQTPFGDSPFAWNDDALEIFWDGNNSKGIEYDGVDDFQVIVPLLTEADPGSNGSVANDSSTDGARFFTGFESVPLDPDTLAFATCPCPGGMQTWEVRIDLEKARLPVGAMIGFEVQLDDDNDGGDRDVKWGWFHPSRVNQDVDNTKDFPSYMSTIWLEPADP